MFTPPKSYCVGGFLGVTCDIILVLQDLVAYMIHLLFTRVIFGMQFPLSGTLVEVDGGFPARPISLYGFPPY